MRLSTRVTIALLVFSHVALGVDLDCVTRMSDMERVLSAPPRDPPPPASTNASKTGLPAREGEPLPRAQVPVVPGYVIEELIGRGGQALVFRATRLADGRVVAIKITARAAQELEALRAVRAGAHAGGAYFVEPIGIANGHLVLGLESQRLADFVEPGGGGVQHLDVERVITQLREAVAALHAAGFVHGDIKPENILITATGEVRLADLGISVRVGERHAGRGTVGFAGANQRELGIAKLADDVVGLDRTIAMLREAQAAPPVPVTDFALIARNLGLDPARYRSGETVNWRLFYAEVGRRLGEMEGFLHPSLVAPLQRLDANARHRYFGGRSQFARPPGELAYQGFLRSVPRPALLAARQAVLARFAEVRELARQTPPNWARIATLLTTDIPALASIGVHIESVGGLVIPSANFRNMGPGDVLPSFNGSTFIESPYRPSWDRVHGRISSRYQYRIRHEGRDYELHDDAVLAFPGLRQNVLRARERFQRDQALAAAEELGHALQDMNLLLDQDNTVASPVLQRIVAANPGLVVDRSPLNNSRGIPATDPRLPLLDGPNFVLYTREADVYLFIVDLFGASRVPATLGTQSSYPERSNLHRLLPPE